MKPKQRDFIRLRAEGLSYQAICDKLRISKTTAKKWNDTLKSEIESLENDMINQLYNDYLLTRQKQIITIGGIFDRINKEINSRDLSDCNTSELLRLQIKYYELLKELYVPTPESDKKSDFIKSVLYQLKSGSITWQNANTQLHLYDCMNDSFVDYDLFDIQPIESYQERG